MSDIRSKVAYLQGLAEGLDIEVSSAEGRILTSMIEVLGDLAEQVVVVAEAHEELFEYVEDVDYDLGALEESIYQEDEDEVTFIPEEMLVDEEDGVEFVSCPNCGEALVAGGGDLEGAVDTVCPACGTALQDATLDYDEMADDRE